MIIYKTIESKNLRFTTAHLLKGISAFLFIALLSGCASNPLDKYFRDTIKREDMPVEKSEEKESANAAITDQAAGMPSNSTDIPDSAANKVAATQLSPQQVLQNKALMLSQTDNAYSIYRREQNNNRNERLTSLIRSEATLALKALKDNDTEQALVHTAVIFNQADFFDRPQPAMYVLRGDIYLKQATLAKDKNTQNDAQQLALSDYRRAISIFPDYALAHNRLGVLHQDRGEFALSLKHFNQALVAWPGYADAYRNRAILKDLYTASKPSALDDYQLYGALLSAQLTTCKTACEQLTRQIKQAKTWVFDLKRQLQRLNMQSQTGSQ